MTVTDWQDVAQIYKEGIATGMATFETSVPSWDVWNASHLATCRFVAIENNGIVGWAALTPVSSRCVYAGVAEVSVYVTESARGKGIGKLLLKNLILASEKEGYWTLQAGIFTENKASVRIHESLGFRVVGKRERIGKLHNVWKDNYLLERRSKKIGI